VVSDLRKSKPPAPQVQARTSPLPPLRHKMPATKPEETGESSTSATKKALVTTNGAPNYELPW